jgi:hypothetical protein
MLLAAITLGYVALRPRVSANRAEALPERPPPLPSAPRAEEAHGDRGALPAGQADAQQGVEARGSAREQNSAREPAQPTLDAPAPAADARERAVPTGTSRGLSPARVERRTVIVEAREPSAQEPKGPQSAPDKPWSERGEGIDNPFR